MRRALGIRQAYTYARRMPRLSDSTPPHDRPKRKAMFLGPEALADLAATAARRRTEREAMEEALALLAERDRQRDAMADFVQWALQEWGEPSDDERSEINALLDTARTTR